MWTPAYILACRAGTTSRYSTGETPPIKAEWPELCLHLGSSCLRGNTSTRIWTRALQPVQEEVSSWRFRRAQIVSGPPTFSADIFARRGDFNARQDSIVRLYFCQTPTFCIPANILGGACILNIHQYFHETPIFWVSANILMRRQYFGYLPIFSWGANILGIRQYFHETPIFCVFANILEGANISCLILLLQIFVDISSIYFMHLNMCQYFWRNCFDLRFKIDTVIMIIWSIVIIINFVLTL